MNVTFPQNGLFGHCDAAGIVFYLRYCQIINDCFEAVVSRIGHSFEEIHRRVAVPMAQIETRFTARNRHGDALTCTPSVVSIGRYSIGLEVTAHAVKEPRLHGASVLARIDTKGRATPWSAHFKTAISPYLRRPS